jgi:hypothetical protein
MERLDFLPTFQEVAVGIHECKTGQSLETHIEGCALHERWTIAKD